MLEARISHEREVPKAFDATLVHGYWYAREGEVVDLSLRSYLACRAASKQYLEGRTKKIVLALGKTWGENNPGLGALMEKECLSLGVKAEDIVLVPKATDTASEIDMFTSLREENRWGNTSEIAFERHFRYISDVQPYRDSHKFLNVEDLLIGDDRRILRVIKRLEHSREELGYFFYENGKRLAKNLGFALERTRLEEGPVSILDRIGLPMDRFDVDLINLLRKVPLKPK